MTSRRRSTWPSSQWGDARHTTDPTSSAPWGRSSTGRDGSRMRWRGWKSRSRRNRAAGRSGTGCSWRWPSFGSAGPPNRSEPSTRRHGEPTARGRRTTRISWPDRVEYEVLRREAEALILGPRRDGADRPGSRAVLIEARVASSGDHFGDLIV